MELIFLLLLMEELPLQLAKFTLVRMGTVTVKPAIGDALITFMWINSATAIGSLTSIITSSYLPHLQLGDFLTTTVLFSIILLIFVWLGDAMGGASFNPTTLTLLYAAGLGK
ncbi:hypothetical protein AMTRI_Chr03g52910 [Amborella trichopoda]